MITNSAHRALKKSELLIGQLTSPSSYVDTLFHHNQSIKLKMVLYLVLPLVSLYLEIEK